MKNKVFLIVSLIFLTSLFGCTKLYHMNQPKEYTQKVSAVGKLAGEWYVTYTLGGADVGGGYTLIDTYNDSNEDKDSLWITDYDGSAYEFWQYTTKVGCSVDALTFSKDSALSTTPGYNIKTNVKNGKVIKDAVTLPSGAKADSIYFEIEYSDDLGHIYHCAGFRRSGFLEDEPQ